MVSPSSSTGPAPQSQSAASSPASSRDASGSPATTSGDELPQRLVWTTKRQQATRSCRSPLYHRLLRRRGKAACRPTATTSCLRFECLQLVGRNLARDLFAQLYQFRV